MSKPELLLVEDDESLALVVGDALEREGYAVERISDGRQALDRARTKTFALIVLDLMLPSMDGYEICKRLTSEGNKAQILMLTARGREEDRVTGLDLGADDYLVKPFSLKELMARVRARLRSNVPDAPEQARIGNAVVDLAAMTVRRDGTVHPLTKMEVGVLKLLIAEKGRVVSRDTFLDTVWGVDRYPSTRTVDMHVARVREKIGDAGPTFIHTAHGVGYRFDPPDGTFEILRDLTT